MNAAAPVVTCTPKRQPITPILTSLHWLPIRQRIKFKVLTLTFKALNNEAPPYIANLIEKYEPPRNLRSSDQLYLSVPRVNLKYGERAFSYCAPKLWNSIPIYVKRSPSVFTFRKNLKTYLFDEL